MNNKIALILTLFFGLIIGFFLGKNSSNYLSVERPNNSTSKQRNSQKEDQGIISLKTNSELIPAKALSVWKYIKENGRAPEDYVGGREFKNLEGKLPKNENGQKITYKEWDINEKVRGKNRGTERLVSSSNGKCYYTADHYKTFIELK